MSGGPRKEKGLKGKGDKYPQSGKWSEGSEGDKYPDDEIGWTPPEGDPYSNMELTDSGGNKEPDGSPIPLFDPEIPPLKDPEIDID
jgi:hypothetical protein